MLNELKAICIHQLIESQVSQTPDAIAVIFEDEQLTYRELNQKANQLAQHLRTLGVKPEVLVGVCVDRSLEMVVALLAILKAGGAYVPLDTSYPTDRLRLMLEDAQVPILLTQSHLIDRLSKCETHFICLDTDWQAIAKHSTTNPQSEVTPDNLAYVIYTSGSTGKPKGVAMPHRPLVNLLTWQQSTVAIGTKTLHFTPISFDVSFQEIFSTLAEGGTLVLISEEMRRDPVSLLRFLNQAAIERLFLPFVALRQLAEVAETEGVAPPSLQEVVTAGEQLRITPSISNWFNQLQNCSLHNHYGPSESHVVTAFTLTGSPKEWPVLPPVGGPIANCEIYLLDAQLQPVPVGVPGELYIGGVSLARGYLNRPDLTEERFIPNPFSPQSGERLYKTGDLAQYLPDGNIEYFGRIDQQVKLRGFRIEPGEIEAVLEQHPLVREAVVIAREDVPGDKRLVAYVVSSLVPDRIPYQSNCFVEFDGNAMKLHTQDISENGVCLVGVPPTFSEGKEVCLRLRLPIECKERWLKGIVAWCEGQQAGIQFQLVPSEQELVQQSVKYLLETQGLLNMVQRTITVNLRDYLKQKLPQYMIPGVFIVLKALPLTPSGKVDRQALPAAEGHRSALREDFVPPRTQVEERLSEIWSQVLGIEPVGIHDNFFDLGGNSLQAIRLISRVRESFQAELPIVSLFDAPTVAKFAEFVNASICSSHTVTSDDTTISELEAETALDPTIDPGSFPMDLVTEPNNIFITGVTGFLGAFLLHELLEQTQANIHCLVRAANPKAGKQKIQSNLEKYLLWNEENSSRIIPVLGDLSQPLLGVSEEKFFNLARKSDVIYHNGASINLIYPYAALRAANVLGTQELLKLATQFRIKPVHFISTLDVFQTSRPFSTNFITEQDELSPSEAIRFDGYTKSKWVSEKMIALARYRGLPVSIYRPAMITGHSKTGAANVNDLMNRLIKGFVQLGHAPRFDMKINIAPADYFSKGAIYLSRQVESLGKAFNFVNPQPLPMNQFVETINACGYPVQQVGHKEWEDLLIRNIGSFDGIVSVLTSKASEKSLSYLEKCSVGAHLVSCQNVMSGLEGTSIVCPPIDAQLLNTYFSYFIHSDFLDAPVVRNSPQDLTALAL